VGRILAITNQKGGVGKTTTCVNLAASLVATKRKVLLIDMDPQGNATMGSGISKDELELSAYDLLMENAKASEVVRNSGEAGYDLIPANADLTAAEVGLLQEQNREYRLRNSIQELADQYHFMLIDCPPSLSMLTINALTAADSVLIHMQCEYYALEGLSALLDTIRRITDVLNPELHIEGLLRTMYDPRNSLTRDVSAQLTNHFGNKVYRTLIPRNVRLAEAPSYGLPVLHYDKDSKGALAYLALAGEILRRQEEQETTKLASSSQELAGTCPDAAPPETNISSPGG
jgi:chromosome partitioning protein